MDSVPALTVVMPVYVLSPVRVSVPAPDLVRANVPVLNISPLKVVELLSKSVSVTTELPTLLVTLPAPAKAPTVSLKPFRSSKPFTIRLLASGITPAAPSRSVLPSLTVVLRVYVLAPERVSVPSPTLVRSIWPLQTPEYVVVLLLLPEVRVGVPEAEPMLPAPLSEPAVRLKPASSSVPVTVRLPIVKSTDPVMSTDSVRVTVWPDAMITSSPATGAVPPTQVAPVLQLPVAAEVMVAACRLAPASRKMERTKALHAA